MLQDGRSRSMFPKYTYLLHALSMAVGICMLKSWFCTCQHPRLHFHNSPIYRCEVYSLFYVFAWLVTRGWHSHAQIHQRNVMHRGRLTCTKCDVKGLECAHHREFYLYVLIKFIDIHENLDPFGSHQSGMYITS